MVMLPVMNLFLDSVSTSMTKGSVVREILRHQEKEER